MLAGSSRLRLAPYSICVTTKFITHSQTFVTDGDSDTPGKKAARVGVTVGVGVEGLEFACLPERTYVQLSKLFIFSSLAFLCWHLFTCVAINFLLRRVAN